MEDFLRACRDAVKDNEPKDLAAKMGLPHVSLLQRANPDDDAHRLTVEHLFGILLHTKDMRPLQALAAEFGYELVAKAGAEAKNLTSALLHIARHKSTECDASSKILARLTNCCTRASRRP